MRVVISIAIAAAVGWCVLFVRALRAEAAERREAREWATRVLDEYEPGWRER